MAEPRVPIEKLLDEVEWTELPEPEWRFANDPGTPYATHKGVLVLGEVRLGCFKLNDGRRIFDVADVAALFGGERNE